MFKSKYIKYKAKYLNLAYQLGGVGEEEAQKTLKNATKVLARPMNFFGPMAKDKLRMMLGKSSPQENPHTKTVQVEAIGSGVVIIPALILIPRTTLNDIKKEIFEHHTSEIKNFQAYRLFLGHGGEELTDNRQIRDIYDGASIVIFGDKIKDDAIIRVTRVANYLRTMSTTLKNDKDIVIAALKRGFKLQEVSEELRNDKDIVMAAVSYTSLELQHVSAELRNDKDIIMATVLRDGFGLKYASEELRNNKAIVMIAVRQYGYALQYASTSLKDDEEIVSIAVAQNGYALQYASVRLRDDRDIVMTAVRRTGDALKFASVRLQDDKQIKELQ